MSCLPEGSSVGGGVPSASAGMIHKEMLTVMTNFFKKKKEKTQIISRPLETLSDQHGHLKHGSVSIVISGNS